MKLLSKIRYAFIALYKLSQFCIYQFYFAFFSTNSINAVLQVLFEPALCCAVNFFIFKLNKTLAYATNF